MHSEASRNEKSSNTQNIFAGDGITYKHTNESLLQLVLSGSGGTILLDSTCDAYTHDSSSVEFPAYIPPQNIGGILQFASMEDYHSFSIAANLMENHWLYPEKDFEDTPDEIYHLGEESFNAFDSVLSFKSLRSIYEFNDFNNNNWRDTASIYVEDDDIQIVLNELNEVKIGNKFYKYVSNFIVAEIDNNIQTLDSTRVLGIFMSGSNIKFYGELENGQIKPEWGEIIQGTQGCPDFRLVLNSGISSMVSPTLIKHSLRTWVMNPVTGNRPRNYRDVMGTYTIDWGDGVVESFVGELGRPNDFYHIYQYPSIGFINRTITVKFQLIQQQNPSSGYLEIISKCPDLLTTPLISNLVIKLDSYNYPDCLTGRMIREFSFDIRIVNGISYRVDCKLKQVSESAGFILNWQRSKVAATMVFRKLKNGKWKKTKSLENMTLILRGNVYENIDCSKLFYTINETRTRNRKKKVKLRILGKVGTEIYFPSAIRTNKNLPIAINADYIWKYNNGQTIVGKYNEVLKP